MGVDECDGEALRCKLEGKLNGWIDMALERIRDENCMRLLSFVACHGAVVVLIMFVERRQEVFFSIFKDLIMHLRRSLK